MSSSSSNNVSFKTPMKQNEYSADFFRSLTGGRSAKNKGRSAKTKGRSAKTETPKPKPKNLEKNLSKLQIQYVAEFINSVFRKPRIRVLQRN